MIYHVLGTLGAFAAYVLYLKYAGLEYLVLAPSGKGIHASVPKKIMLIWLADLNNAVIVLHGCKS
ncbi:hypothetical protein T440DRAFT_467288 [Plenodomus tracheiphilus IPT5]|uniref:Uncharacterized protein n=1 Tax=Plenodomus tracheiphilus IPT5 TaxID=1408161 RepID=A0A6A7B929_9PLEO|nr:hypothetical protein T440DRAFT_467288 [Plenodomus tracheiphilus IPT5]